MPPARRLLTLSAAVLLASAAATAQVTVTPDTVRVTLAAGTQAEVPLAVAHAGDDTLALALALAPAPSAADPPGAPGDVLFTSEEICCGLGGMTMTPGGRVFVAEQGQRDSSR